MIIVNKNDGHKIEYEQNGTCVSFADGELSIDLAKYQRDWAVNLDICSNKYGCLVIGTDSGLNYVAQINIPAREYIYPEPEPVEAAEAFEDSEETPAEISTEQQQPPTPIPLDMEKVTLSLWSIDV